MVLASGDYLQYFYDTDSALTKEHRKDSNNATKYYNNFFYDSSGNRTKLQYNAGQSTTTTTYLHNGVNQLTKEQVGGGSTWTYTYDSNGALTRKADGSTPRRRTRSTNRSPWRSSRLKAPENSFQNGRSAWFGVSLRPGMQRHVILCLSPLFKTDCGFM